MNKTIIDNRINGFEIEYSERELKAYLKKKKIKTLNLDSPDLINQIDMVEFVKVDNGQGLINVIKKFIRNYHKLNNNQIEVSYRDLVLKKVTRDNKNIKFNVECKILVNKIEQEKKQHKFTIQRRKLVNKWIKSKNTFHINTNF